MPGTKKIVLIFILVITLCSFTNTENYQSDEQVIKYIFNKIEQGLDRGDVSAFKYYLNGKIFLSLANDVTGYYTLNHSYYILTDYFELYRPTSFTYERVSSEAENPFGYGTYSYYKSGEYGSQKVFISLERINHQWKITQITFS